MEITLSLNAYSILFYLLIVFISWIILKKLIYEKLINPVINLSSNNINNKLILITGCDSGFGNQTAIKLYKMGFSILGTCLTLNGKKELLKEINNINSNNNKNTFNCIIVDITNDNDINKMKQYLIKECLSTCTNSLHLWCIINNAGIMRTAEFDLLTLNDFKNVFEVNVFGSIRVIKSLIHLLRQTRYSRIINIVSSSVLIPMYGYSAYVTSKCSLEALSIILRAELSSFNCYVSSVLPGANNTNILNTKINLEIYKNRIQNLNKNILNDYGNEYFELSAKRCILGTKMVTPNNLNKVVDSIIDGVIRQRPYRRYIVGYDALFMYWITYLPLFIQEFLISTPLKPWCKPKMMR